MGVTTTQRNATRNQSTADFELQNLFLSGNRYQATTFKNTTASAIDAKDGILVLRDAAGIVRPAIAGATLADVIGILKFEDVQSVAAGASVTAYYCISGDIDVNLLVLPDTVTIDTVVGTKLLRDVLTGLGFVLFNVTDGSKFNN